MKYKVVCGFNGTIYSNHKTEENAERASKMVKNRLLKAVHSTGNLPYYVQVVPESFRFTNIVPADNQYGCVQISQKRWVE